MSRPLRLATFNIAHGRGRGGRVDLARTAATLAALAADVICLQEVDRHYGERSGRVDQAAELGARLRMTAVYGAAVRLDPERAGDPPREYGNAVLTRAAATASAVHPLPVRERAEPRCLLLVELADVTVGCLHLQHNNPQARARQAAAAVELLPHDRPAVLAGDLNADPGDPELAALRQRLRDVWPLSGRGRGATFPSRLPRRRLDQVYVDGAVSPLRARVVPTDASDHRPLVVDLVVG